MGKKAARFWVFMLWSGVISLIILLVLFFLGRVQWYRLFDAASIAFFFSLAALIIYKGKYVGVFSNDAAFFLSFLIFAGIPYLGPKRFPLAAMDDSDFSSWIFLLVAAVAIIAVIIHRQKKFGEFFTAVFNISLNAIFGILVGLHLYYSIVYGIVVSFLSMGILFFKSVAAAILALVFAVFMWLIIWGFGKIISGLRILKNAVISLHQNAFSGGGERGDP